MQRSRRMWFSGVNVVIQGDMEKWLDELAGISQPVPVYSGCAWTPAVDVYETDDEVVVTVEAAGIEREALKVVLEGQTLTVSGIRRERPREAGQRYQRMEICSGSFERSIPLPSKVSAEGASATYEDGLVEVRLPKAVEPAPKRVRISTGSRGQSK